MAETITVARPYAQAAFEFAEAQHLLQEWADMLVLLANVVTDKDMAELLDSPRLTEQQLSDLIIDICGDRLSDKGANFVRVLATNIKADLVSAYPATEEQQARIIESLRRRLGKQIELRCSTDASLIGGAIIRAGDLVIDGSVRGKLQRLGSSLSH